MKDDVPPMPRDPRRRDAATPEHAPPEHASPDFSSSDFSPPDEVVVSSREEAIRGGELTSMRMKVPFPESGPLVSLDPLREPRSLGDQITPPPIEREQPDGDPDARIGEIPYGDQEPCDRETERLSDEDPMDDDLPPSNTERNDTELPSSEQPIFELNTPAVVRSGPNPVIQSLTLIASMIIMLLIARFSVPRIVEEIRYSWHRGQLRAEYETGGEGLKNVSLDSLSRAYEMVTSTVGPSVVHIDVQRKPQSDQGTMRQIFGDQLFATADQGSGVVVDEEGFVLTNRHVIVDGASIFVTLGDGRRLPARVVGTDSLTDIAVLKVDADRLMPIQWGDSDALRVGSPVWAVGSPFGLDRTVTFGILSGKHRRVRAGERHGASGHYQDFMQSDVAVNPGNSGGPLVDAKGTLVGINTAIVGDTFQGVSFSIPSNLSRQVYESIRKTGRVQRGYLGVGLQDVPDDLFVGENTRVRGALVTSIAGTASPAAIAGVVEQDVIERADGVDIIDMGHLMRIVGDAGAGRKVVLDVRRGRNSLQLTVQLGNRPFELN